MTTETCKQHALHKVASILFKDFFCRKPFVKKKLMHSNSFL